MTADEVHQLLVEAAERFVRLRRDAVVIVARGAVDVIRAAPGGRTAEPEPGELRGYEIRIIAALADIPVSARRLARAAQLRFNSYFRGQLAMLVEAGLVRRTRRGYSRPRG